MPSRMMRNSARSSGARGNLGRAKFAPRPPFPFGPWHGEQLAANRRPPRWMSLSLVNGLFLGTSSVWALAPATASSSNPIFRFTIFPRICRSISCGPRSKMVAVPAMLSIVIPVHNEERSILPLYDRLTVVLESLRRPYEILLRDDSSTDRSFELLGNLVETDARLIVIRMRRNFGQTAALSAGCHEGKGATVIAMDGDVQHAPEDIPALLAKIDEGYDI